MLAIEDKKVVRLLLVLFWGLLAFFALFLLRIHWVRAYSDPTGWVERGIFFYEQGVLPRHWSVVYPLYLYWPLQLLGPHYVYISNLPWLIAMVALLGGVSARHYRGYGHEDRPKALMYGLWTMLTIVFLGWRVMGELINPYREAVAFSLLLAAFYVVVGPRGLRVWRAGVAGLLFGVSVAMREPHILALPALLLVLLYWLYVKLPNRAWTYLPTMIGGVLVGLLPFFIQNQVSGGYWWVPVYLVRNMEPIIERFHLHSVFIVQPWILALVSFAVVIIGAFVFRHFAQRPPLTVAQRKKYWCWCFFVLVTLLLVLTAMLAVCLYTGIIPHMDMHRFKRVGPNTLRHLRGQWGSIGGFLLAVGVIGMGVRKEWRLLAITVPSGLLFLLFWSFYAYVKPRYVFSVQLFAYPIMGYGACVLTQCFGWLKPARPFRNLIPVAAVALAALALSVQLGWKAFQGNDSLKVWQMPRIRADIEAVVERPMVIDCANWRHTCLLANVMATRERHMLDIWRRNSFAIDWREVMRGRDLDVGLTALSHDILRDVTENHVYDYGPRRAAVRFWLDRVPVINLGALPGRLDLYGRVMDDYLHKLVPWSRFSFSYSLADYPVDEVLLVGMDLFRLWDYPERTYCRLSAGTFEVDLHRTNHFVWVTLPADSMREALSIESDAPLPSEPYIQVLRQNETIDIDFGVNGACWYRNYIDPSYEHAQLIHSGAIFLLDEKRVRVPIFADENHDVFVAFLMAYQRQDLFYPEKVNVQLRHGQHEVSGTLVARQVSQEVILPLGRGNGMFALRDVALQSSLPSLPEQQANRESGVTRNFGRIPMANMRVWTLPHRLPAEYVFSIDADHRPWLQRADGMYAVEQWEHGSFAWGKPDVTLRLPAAATDGDYTLSVTLVNHRPEAFPPEPQYFWNGSEIFASRQEAGEHSVIRTYYFDSILFQEAQENDLRIVSNEWVPARDSNIPDSRTFGVGIARVSWVRAE